LREIGFHRTYGLDLSEDLLEVALREVAGQDGLARGDMRQLPFGPSFRAVLSLFTSFGYFQEEEENQATLREIHRVLVPGGRVLIDLPSYGLADRLVPETEREIDGIKVIEKRRYDSSRKRIEKEILIESEEGKETFFESVRVYFYGEIMKMFAEAGLAVEGLYGDFKGGEFDPRGERMIVIGQRTTAPAHLMR
jgi:SAM-dependent methyltransferase